MRERGGGSAFGGTGQVVQEGEGGGDFPSGLIYVRVGEGRGSLKTLCSITELGILH